MKAARARPARVALPLVGRIAAGRPFEAIPQPDTIEVPADLTRGADNYALRVVGDSMVDEGIRDGDVIIVRPQRDAADGDTVVALIGDDATIKRYFRRGSLIELRPANAAVAVLVVDEADLQIQGIVVGILRGGR